MRTSFKKTSWKYFQRMINVLHVVTFQAELVSLRWKKIIDLACGDVSIGSSVCSEWTAWSRKVNAIWARNHAVINHKNFEGITFGSWPHFFKNVIGWKTLYRSTVVKRLQTTEVTEKSVKFVSWWGKEIRCDYLGLFYTDIHMVYSTC